MMSELATTEGGQTPSLSTTSTLSTVSVARTLPQELVLWDVDSTIAEEEATMGTQADLHMPE